MVGEFLIGLGVGSVLTLVFHRTELLPPDEPAKDPYERYNRLPESPWRGISHSPGVIEKRVTPWAVLYRCLNCAKSLDRDKPEDKPKLCSGCGAGGEMLVPWVGCTVEVKVHALRLINLGWPDSGSYTNWVPFDRLAKEIVDELPVARNETGSDGAKPETESQIRERLEAEFDARVRAAVEIELALRGKL